jgi:hypothetical protein
LDIDVLVSRTGEDLPFSACVDEVFAIVALFDRPDCVQQRQNGVPLDVMARGMLKDLQQSVALTVV